MFDSLLIHPPSKEESEENCRAGLTVLHPFPPV